MLFKQKRKTNETAKINTFLYVKHPTSTFQIVGVRKSERENYYFRQ